MYYKYIINILKSEYSSIFAYYSTSILLFKALYCDYQQVNKTFSFIKHNFSQIKK